MLPKFVVLGLERHHDEVTIPALHPLAASQWPPRAVRELERQADHRLVRYLVVDADRHDRARKLGQRRRAHSEAQVEELVGHRRRLPVSQVVDTGKPHVRHVYTSRPRSALGGILTKSGPGPRFQPEIGNRREDRGPGARQRRRELDLVLMRRRDGEGTPDIGDPAEGVVADSRCRVRRRRCPRRAAPGQ